MKPSHRPFACITDSVICNLHVEKTTGCQYSEQLELFAPSGFQFYWKCASARCLAVWSICTASPLLTLLTDFSWIYWALVSPTSTQTLHVFNSLSWKSSFKQEGNKRQECRIFREKKLIPKRLTVPIFLLLDKHKYFSFIGWWAPPYWHTGKPFLLIVWGGDFPKDSRG